MEANQMIQAQDLIAAHQQQLLGLSQAHAECFAQLQAALRANRELTEGIAKLNEELAKHQSNASHG